jgi:hypothetical protein
MSRAVANPSPGGPKSRRYLGPAAGRRLAVALAHVDRARNVLFAGPRDRWDAVASALLTALDVAKQEALDHQAAVEGRK